MKLYLTVISLTAAVITGIHIALDIAPFHYALIAVLWCIALEFAIDGGMAILIRLTPDRWYPAFSPRFRVSAFEKKLYLKLKVRLWKDKIWELGGLGGFSKKKLLSPDDPAYVEKFIVECHKGVVTHRLSYPLGFLILLTLPAPLSLTTALPVALVNLLLNILPTLALRYNTPMLQGMLRRMQSRQRP
ncbi:MAG: hypothetical protein E7610_03210 [Ruminococcaceae bacterium]|nr:hypothetical protein [Oscillospiraceae bacterium]